MLSPHWLLQTPAGHRAFDWYRTNRSFRFGHSRTIRSSSPTPAGQHWWLFSEAVPAVAGSSPPTVDKDGAAFAQSWRHVVGSNDQWNQTLRHTDWRLVAIVNVMAVERLECNPFATHVDRHCVGAHACHRAFRLTKRRPQPEFDASTLAKPENRPVAQKFASTGTKGAPAQRSTLGGCSGTIWNAVPARRRGHTSSLRPKSIQISRAAR